MDIIIGVDYHPSMQQIAFVDTGTGEYGERELNHSDGEAEKFYRCLKQRGVTVRVGMEATGHSRWFERLMAELGFELWIGDPAKIKAARVRKQKADREDARLIFKLLMENRFPRVWIPNPANRDLRQLLWHRHRLVQMRTRVMNQLQAVAMSEGVGLKRALWNKSGRAKFSQIGITATGSLGYPAPPGFARASRPVNTQDRRAQHRNRRAIIEPARSATAHDPSGRWSDHGACVRVDYRNTGALSLWQTTRQLSGPDSVRGLQCQASAARSHQ
jgi:hypothetical protein